MTIETVIDLDREPVEPEPPVGRREWRGWRRPALAALSVGLLGSIAAADAATTPVASRMEGLTLTASAFEIDDGSLVVTWPSGFGTVHHLPSGEQVGDLGPDRQAVPGSGGALGLTVTRPLVGTSADGGVLVTYSFHEAVTMADRGGNELWSAGPGGGAPWQVVGALPLQLAGEPLVLTFDRESLTLRDGLTGEVRAHRAVTSGDDSLGGMVVAATITGGILAVSRSDAMEEWTTVGLDPRTLAVRWENPYPAGSWVEACGDWLCLHQVGGGMSVLDPATGREKWTTESAASTIGQWVLLDDRVLVDPATGGELLDLTGWQVHRSGPDGEILLGRWVVTHTGAGERSETVLAEVPAGGSPEVRIRGRIPARVHDCAPFDGGVVCRDKSQSGVGERPDWAERLGVWQF